MFYFQREEKTIVYVLTQNDSNFGPNGEYIGPQPVTSKPEVFFVKYNTKEEEQSAISRIQDSFQQGGPGYDSPASFSQ